MAHRRKSGFTLVELLVATAVFTLLLLLCVGVVGQISNVWRRSSANVEAFQGARLGYDLATRTLSQATLNTYLDYDNATNPTRYLRNSDMHFLCGPAGSGGLPGTPNTGTAVFFQTPAVYTENTSYRELDGALNPAGYFVQFGANDSWAPSFAGGKQVWRYRLLQLLAPTENNLVFACTKPSSSLSSDAWFANFIDTYSRPVADNIIAFIVRPIDPAAPSLFTNSYIFDSRMNATNDPQPVSANQLPPVLQATMVAIDEESAQRLANGSTAPAEITAALSGKFETASDFDKDLEDLKTALSAARINYHIFSSAIPLRESKWTK